MTGPVGLNEQIMVHARNATWWRHHEEAKRVYSIFSAANVVLFNAELPAAVIGFDDEGRLQKDGGYTFEGDALGLKHHIDLKKGLSGVQLVVSLLHQMVHLHQETYQEKKTWYHSTKFRSQMLAMGIQVGSDGDAKALLPSFATTLNKVGLGGLLEEMEGYEPAVVVEAEQEEPEQAATLEGPAKFGWPEGTPEGSSPSGVDMETLCKVCGCTWQFDHFGWTCKKPPLPMEKAPEPAVAPPAAPKTILLPTEEALLQAGVKLAAKVQLFKAGVSESAFALPPKKPLTAKQRKWSCHCSSIRAYTVIDMTCNKCGYKVELQD
jgi:hypothetical protein